jgi:16S rRNA (cytidine1402-2'-O)-methyltransferase
VEDAKSCRAFLKRVGERVPLAAALQALNIVELPRPRKGGDKPAAPETAAWKTLLAPVVGGEDMGLLSEAGLPGVADPGAALVLAAHQAGLEIEALAGASSLTLGLAASGLNGQRFAFEGYLPQQPEARAVRVRELEARSRRENQTQLVIETPYRNQALFSALVQALRGDTLLGVACGLTLPGGWCRTRSVEAWRLAPLPTVADKLPSVFMWLAS